MNATVTGTVEVIMTNKFDSEKIALKLEWDDTWFNQKREWMEVMPKRGQEVSFYRGKTKEGELANYIKNLEVIGGVPASVSAPAKGGNYNLGIELGHAANNAVQLAIAGKKTDLESVKKLTKDFYDMMKELRQEYEGTKVVQEEPKAVVKKAAAKKPAPVEADFDDDIPF